MIDAHIHADCRPYEDFEKMAVAGVEKAVTLAHDPLPMSNSGVVMDHFHRMLNHDRERAAANGIELFVALGVHPRSICPDVDLVLEELPLLLEDQRVVALGEVGLEMENREQEDIFKAQLLLADELDMKVVVHTPRRKKREVTQRTLSIIAENINPTQVQLDHVDASIVDLALEYGGLMGLTVQPLKVSPGEAVELLEEYGCEGFVLNSDMSSSPSDPLSVPKTVHQMRLAGLGDDEVEMVSHQNAADFYGI
ncbi:MAG: TatD family hydrolase [Euryarchaeota archaeon]|jgi:predicted metal-dependent TIM-barrel fold hydrolase|nr:TatD family hydrolase [Euryarchaeota archaeon]